jgi:hypothetical protein
MLHIQQTSLKLQTAQGVAHGERCHAVDRGLEPPLGLDHSDRQIAENCPQAKVEWARAQGFTYG